MTLTEICVECGGPRSAQSLNKVCRACYMKAHAAQDSRPNCLDCGIPITFNQRRKRCWNCHTARLAAQKILAHPKCELCGGPVSTRTTKVCMACIADGKAISDAARVCMDCGVPIIHFKALRCKPCSVKKQRDEAANRVCTICGRKAKAKGLCANHYKAAIDADTRGSRRRSSPRGWIASLPCGVCGYDKLRSHVHRPLAGGKYEIGNMVPLCSRCHDEVHAGITPCPDLLLYVQFDS